MDVNAFLDGLSTLGVDFYTGVPDSLLRPLGDTLYARHGLTGAHVVAANEGGAVGLAAGHYIATGRPALVYLQNSGIGNIINPVASLLHPLVYGIPCVFAVGWRGEPGVPDEPQHAFQGTVTPQMLEGCGLRVLALTKTTDAGTFAAMLAECAPLLASGRSVAFLISKDGLDGGEATPFANERRMTREAALEALLTHAPEDDLFVVTTGKASREVFELRERLHKPHGHDFLTVGSMGHAGMIALGLAKAAPERTVWCVDGDGAMLMHMGALAVEAQQRATNLIHVVLNNGAHESVGGMPVAGGAFWFGPVAHAVGFEAVFTAESAAELAALAARVRDTARRKLCFLEIMVSTGARANLGRPTQTPRQNLQALMETIQNGGTNA